MKKILIALALSSLYATANAAVIDITATNSVFIAAQDGFNFSGSSGIGSWVNGRVVSWGSVPASSGYAWSNGGADLDMSLATPGSFTFNSVSLFEGYVQPVTINGYLNGNLIHSYEATLNPGAFTNFALNWTGVDRVVFSNGMRANLMVSELTVNEQAANNEVPEPGSIALIGLGMLGFIAARRKSAQ